VHLRGELYFSEIFVLYYLSSEFAPGSLRDVGVFLRCFFLGGGASFPEERLISSNSIQSRLSLDLNKQQDPKIKWDTHLL
jgi:hypothetical protein